METGNHLAPAEGWGKDYVSGEEWARLQNLLDLVRREHLRTEMSPERREQIRERVLERFEQAEARRHRVRTLVARTSLVLLAGMMLTVLIIRRALRD
jgi:hypothetical protein